MARSRTVVIPLSALRVFSDAVEVSSLGTAECNDLLRVISAVRRENPGTYQAWRGIDRFAEAVTAQRDRVQWANSTHVRGQLDLDGHEVALP